MARGLGAISDNVNVFDLEYGEREANGIDANGAVDELDIDAAPVVKDELPTRQVGLIPNRREIGSIATPKRVNYDVDMPPLRSTKNKRMSIKDLM